MSKEVKLFSELPLWTLFSLLLLGNAQSSQDARSLLTMRWRIGAQPSRKRHNKAIVFLSLSTPYSPTPVQGRIPDTNFSLTSLLSSALSLSLYPYNKSQVMKRSRLNSKFCVSTPREQRYHVVGVVQCWRTEQVRRVPVMALNREDSRCLRTRQNLRPGW